MRLLGVFVIVCVALAAIQAAFQLIAVVIVAAVVVGLIFNPRETLGTLFGLVLLGLMASYPLVGLPLLLAIMVFGIRLQGRH